MFSSDVIMSVIVSLGFGLCFGIIIGAFFAHSICQGYSSDLEERFINKINNLYIHDKGMIEFRFVVLDGKLDDLSIYVKDIIDNFSFSSSKEMLEIKSQIDSIKSIIIPK